MENLLTEGMPGHEFIFAANIHLNDASYYQREEIQLVEDNKAIWTARWFDPRNLPDGVALYPRGNSRSRLRRWPAGHFD